MVREATRDQWLEARLALLEREKAFTRERDALSAARRALPGVAIDSDYTFATEHGQATLADLFGGRRQLIIYHFMFGHDWKEGCPSCSFWADNYNGTQLHLAHLDTSLVAVSTAPLETLLAYRARMGWTFDWVSSGGCDFNRDFGVTFDADERDPGEAHYNYGHSPITGSEAPGISVFLRDTATGRILHTYSTYARGLDMLNGAYHLIDLTPLGRQEEGKRIMHWLRRRDQYQD
jgi:predicted dithiol-disulfide oxidoreductase (DUF899 family)